MACALFIMKNPLPFPYLPASRCIIVSVAERGGNVFTFLMEYENYSFPEAVKTLAQRAGVNLPEAEESEEARRAESKRTRLLAVNKEAAKYFYYQLRARTGRGGDAVSERQAAVG